MHGSQDSTGPPDFTEDTNYPNHITRSAQEESDGNDWVDNAKPLVDSDTLSDLIRRELYAPLKPEGAAPIGKTLTKATHDCNDLNKKKPGRPESNEDKDASPTKQ